MCDCNTLNGTICISVGFSIISFPMMLLLGYVACAKLKVAVWWPKFHLFNEKKKKKIYILTFRRIDWTSNICLGTVTFYWFRSIYHIFINYFFADKVCGETNKTYFLLRTKTLARPYWKKSQLIFLINRMNCTEYTILFREDFLVLVINWTRTDLG